MQHHLLAPILGLALLAIPTQAQSHTFDHVASENAWTWSATTSVGSLTGVPNQDFEVEGFTDANISGTPFANGQVTGGVLTVTSDLNGYVPGPFGIHLADVNVTNLTFTVDTLPFALDASGNFITDWTVTFITGTLTVVALGGSTSTTDLAGTSGPPTLNNGSITVNSTGDAVIHSDQTSTFSFVDAGTGISADFTITGTLHGTASGASSDPGTSFCIGDGAGTACPCGNNASNSGGCANGSGNGAVLNGSGSNSIAANDLILEATNLIPSQPGLYFQGNNAINSGNGNPFGDGLRCAGGGVIRLQVRFSSSAGESSTTASISVNGGVAAGDTKRYQIWYRDPNTSPCNASFNLSNGYEITWSA